MTGSNTFSQRISARIPLLVIWVFAVLIAWFFAMLLRDSASLDGINVPQGNDSFYHARRVLDAVGARGFYEFDERLHAPDGRLVPWPWAYDYLLARVAQAALWLDSSVSPLGVVFWVPVVWILVNASLFLAATGAIGLSIEMRAVAMLCFALSPFTQLLHAFGMLDHHYVEHTFVLLDIWLGLRWFQSPGDVRWAVALGTALGLAPGFHNGLFVLQIMPLACVLVLWLRCGEPPRRSLLAFAGALLVAMQLVLWPSATFRAGLFEFGLLSWFHLYFAVCTAACMAYMATWRHSRTALVGLIALALLLSAPIVGQLLGGASFVAGGFSILDEVAEAKSVYENFTGDLGPLITASFYSWLVLLSPALIVWYAYRLLTERAADRLFYSIVVLFGLGLLAAQFRFHYFGFFALVTGGLVLLDNLRIRLGWHRGVVVVATLLAVVLAYQPALRNRLFQVYRPGIDAEYTSSMPLYLRLGRECAMDPGVVLANNNDGNPILFHTECAVITNNFILTKADDDHLRRAGQLLRARPAELRQLAPEVKYLLVRTDDFRSDEASGRRLITSYPLVSELLLAPEPPPGFELVYTVDKTADARGPEDVYARLYKIAAAGGSGP